MGYFPTIRKYPISKWLLNNVESEKEISVDINWRNLPEIPHGEMCDFFKFLISFATSIGDVFKRDRSGMFWFLSILGAGSLLPHKFDFEAK